MSYYLESGYYYSLSYTSYTRHNFVQVDLQTEMDAMGKMGRCSGTFGLTNAETCLQQLSTSKPKFSKMTGAPFPVCFDGSYLQFHEAASSFPLNALLNTSQWEANLQAAT